MRRRRAALASATGCRTPPAQISSMGGVMLTFPPGFLFGTATAATQIEGGCTTSDWYAFARQPGRVRHGDTPKLACDGWKRWPEDVALQRSLGLGAYRMSVEWARIEPRDGETDRAALDTYRRMLGALRDAGIEPMVTLHHFTLPQWAAERGGVLAEEFPRRLARFARVAVNALGDLCRLWITINEPNVLAAHGYLLGIWPPARRSPGAALLAHYRLLEAHVAAYRELKHARGDGVEVGVAHHLRIAQPERDRSVGDRWAARALQHVFSDAFAAAMCDGRMYGPLDALAARTGRPYGFRVSEARGTHDFFGINYYSRDLVRLSGSHAAELFIARSVPPGAAVSDLGWEIYPEGLGVLVRRWAGRSSLPVYVTENGIADASDDKRGPFLVRHLAELLRALADGVPVRGYFHWSLLDNFEWAEGYGPRFGLVEVDYATQQRRPRPSAQLYARIARECTLPDG
jgi:beta-glucosidase